MSVLGKSSPLNSSGLDHNRRLEERGGRHQAGLVLFERGPIGLRFRLIEQQRQQRGRVEHHQRGTPCSSYPTISSAGRSSSVGSAAQRRVAPGWANRAES